MKLVINKDDNYNNLFDSSAVNTQRNTQKQTSLCSINVQNIWHPPFSDTHETQKEIIQKENFLNLLKIST